MRICLLLPVLLFCFLWIVVGGVAPQSKLPHLQPADCSELRQRFVEAQPQRLECWRLIVPWFRDGRESLRQMELFALRLKSLVKSDQAPILYLPGGPGEAASLSLREWLAAELSQDHDIILLDPRGTGFSRPTLHCREARPSGHADWVRVCRERFAASALDLSAFALSEVLRDYVDLLSVLGDAQVNVYGHSFGSRLALMLADAAPERIRALVLDGVYPPPVYDLAELARNLDSALDRLFADCARDSACGRAFPNLVELFYRTAAELNATPQTVIMPGLDIGLSLNGSDYIFLLWSWLHDTGAIPYLPAFIESLARGAYEIDPLTESALFARSDDARIRRNESAFLSLRCPEDLAAPAAEPAPAEESDIHPLLLAAVRELVADHYAKCQSWNVPTAVSRLTDPVASDIPSLLFSGAYDPATPPRWGDFALAHLSKAWHFIFPQVGHGALAAAPCATNIMRAFLEDPTRAPTADCFAAQAPPVFLTQE
ncbi:MAG: alpha/beta fold hydrolase [Chloroflexi bacterium]|nr:alpha/beta fold hydrolase [Chloroflexota bacterium]